MLSEGIVTFWDRLHISRKRLEEEIIMQKKRGDVIKLEITAPSIKCWTSFDHPGKKRCKTSLSGMLAEMNNTDSNFLYPKKQYRTKEVFYVFAPDGQF